MQCLFSLGTAEFGRIREPLPSPASGLAPFVRWALTNQQGEPATPFSRQSSSREGLLELAAPGLEAEPRESGGPDSAQSSPICSRPGAFSKTPGRAGLAI